MKVFAAPTRASITPEFMRAFVPPRLQAIFSISMHTLLSSAGISCTMASNIVFDVDEEESVVANLTIIGFVEPVTKFSRLTIKERKKEGGKEDGQKGMVGLGERIRG